jgi:hypothetical protein
MGNPEYTNTQDDDKQKKKTKKTTPHRKLDRQRGNKKSTKKVKEPLSFEIWIFRNDQPDLDGDSRMFVVF